MLRAFRLYRGAYMCLWLRVSGTAEKLWSRLQALHETLLWLHIPNSLHVYFILSRLGTRKKKDPRKHKDTYLALHSSSHPQPCRRRAAGALRRKLL